LFRKPPFAMLRQSFHALFEKAKTSGRMMHQVNERCAVLETFHFEIGNDDFDVRFQTMEMPSRIAWTRNDAEKMISTERIVMTYFVSWTESFVSFR
jgi:hypothetical protein